MARLATQSQTAASGMDLTSNSSGLTEGKICKTCGSWKHFAYFHYNPGNKDGYRGDCVACNTEKMRQRYEENRQSELERKKKYRAENRDACSRSTRSWHNANRERIAEYVKLDRANDPEKYRLWSKASDHRRRIRSLEAEGSFTTSEWVDLCNRYGNRCLRCGEEKRLTVDHVTPISKGGSNYISNIQPLCLECNSRKSTSIIDYRGAE